MSDYDNTNRGAMFPNQYKEDGDKKLTFYSNLNVDGKDLKIAKTWETTSKAGKDYLSVKVTEPELSGTSTNNEEVPF